MYYKSSKDIKPIYTNNETGEDWGFFIDTDVEDNYNSTLYFNQIYFNNHKGSTQNIYKYNIHLKNINEEKIKSAKKSIAEFLDLKDLKVKI